MIKNLETQKQIFDNRNDVKRLIMCDEVWTSPVHFLQSLHPNVRIMA